jgi:O-antigen/teichoic acid export membrane protein
MSSGKKLLRGSALRTFGFFVQVITVLLVTPFIVNTLGDKAYGYWVLVGSVVGYYALFDFGFQNALVQGLGKAFGQNDTEAGRKLTATTFYIYLTLAAIVLTVTGVVVCICQFFIPDPTDVTIFRVVAVLMGLRTAVVFVGKLFDGVLAARVRYDLSVVGVIMNTLLSYGCIYLVLREGYALKAMGVCVLFAATCQFAYSSFMARREYGELTLSWSAFDRDQVKGIFSFSINTFIIRISNMLRFQAQNFVIGHYMGAAAVTPYSLGVRLIVYFMEFILAVFGVMLPIYSRDFGRDDPDLIRKRFLQVTQLSTIVAGYVGASLYFYFEPFVVCWLGEGYEETYACGKVLTISATMALTQTSCNTVLMGVNRHKTYARICLAEGIINVVLSIILVQKMGLIGAAWSTTITLGARAIIQGLYTCHAIKLSYWRYYKLLLRNAYCTIAPVLIYCHFVQELVQPTYLSMAIYNLGQVALIGPILYFLVSKSTRQTVIGAVLKKTKK